jgi:tetratricopeptide (TPR) repeat protein
MNLLKRLWPGSGRTSAGDRRDRGKAPRPKEEYDRPGPGGHPRCRAAGGKALPQREEYDRAVASFTAAIRLDPSAAAAYRDRGLAYEEQGKYEQAIADYTEALRLDPPSADAYFQRGNALFARDQFGRAIADYGRALALDPGLALAYYYRGLAYIEKGDAARGNAASTCTPFVSTRSRAPRMPDSFSSS